ncbi:hypothetical protein MTR_0029s0130 [Medicago truncatula]|uniref:Uncharacterized protein n=1 Tax=Medicago truncatula TaxID=3880 RepID=A0A072TK35_MEDTR|nr:hypothetical protein MTR_0029s0130 [Medicago truncatula]
MLQFAKGGSPDKLQKALANARLPGAVPGAESAANMPIANYTARALAPGKGPGLTPGKMCLIKCRIFWSLQTVSVARSPFQKHVGRFARG